MRFQVPQFIDVEDKIFGPLTFKQFIYLAGGGGLTIVFFLFLPKFIAIIPTIIILAFSFSLAFYKINNRPFVFFLESFVMYIGNPKLYIWKKEEPELVQKEEKKVSEPVHDQNTIPRLSNSKLKDLTWSLDTRSAIDPSAKSDVTTL